MRVWILVGALVGCGSADEDGATLDLPEEYVTGSLIETHGFTGAQIDCDGDRTTVTIGTDAGDAVIVYDYQFAVSFTHPDDPDGDDGVGSGGDVSRGPGYREGYISSIRDVQFLLHCPTGE